MDDIVSQFIRANQVDSFQKLRFLLFLHQHPDLKATSREFARQLYLGSELLIEKIITDLCKAGLVDRDQDRFKLHNAPDISWSLQCLNRAFEDPLARQRVLDRIRYSGYSGYHLETSYRSVA